MKLTQHRVRLTILASVFAAGAATVHAAEPSNYVGVHGGVSNLKHWGATVGLGAGVTVPGDVSLDGKTHLGVAIGRQYDNSRFELEYQSAKFDVTAIQLGAVRQDTSGSGRYEAFTLNAYRTQAFNATWSGYAGLGIGWGSASLPQLGFTGGCNCFSAASGSGVAYLARVGLEYSFGKRHHTFAQYTVLGLPKISSGTPQTAYGRKSVGVVGVGYRFVF